MRKVSKIEPISPSLPTRKKVAAYARVSMETERLNHSLSAQVSYYSNLIQSNPEWEYAGVYADNAVTGTKSSSREEFQRMLEDCEAGKIDIILTKSISRFARNTVDLLEAVRHLKELGIEVRFEKEHINSLSGDGEVMLTLLASFAQEEIRSLSENVRWGTRKRFEQGIPNGRFLIYGYRWEGDHLVVEPEEAKIVRLIYDNFLKGLSAEATEKQLDEMGVKSMKGMHFPNSSIRAILKNITYTGNLLFQKEYTLDPISKKTRKNHGELPQYFVENTHEAIIPMETYQAVQAEIARRRELGALANWSINTSCFTSKIKCGLCGASFVRNTRKNRAKTSQLGERYTFYGCGTNKRKGEHCSSGTIREDVLKEECAKALGLPDNMVYRQPFPGPGLGVRCLGAITRERLEAVRESDAILREEFAKNGLEGKVWQYFTVVPDFKSVGVSNNARTFAYPVILRAVNTVDAMTATVEDVPFALLQHITERITHEVKGVNRVLYDLTPKPTGTIEWE